MPTTEAPVNPAAAENHATFLPGLHSRATLDNVLAPLWREPRRNDLERLHSSVGRATDS